MEKVASALQPFDIEFQPFIDEISAKEGAIRECADAATMARIRSMVLHICFGYNRAKSNEGIQTSKVSFRILHQN